MTDKKKYAQLDLIEKHRVCIWWNTRQHLQSHIDRLDQKLSQYDLSEMPAADLKDAPLPDLDQALSKLDA
ncbi:MAG: hypothetical protein NXI24_05565 [bacterium]|nr:hypothetical protein [bacterium]